MVALELRLLPARNAFHPLSSDFRKVADADVADSTGPTQNRYTMLQHGC